MFSWAWPAAFLFASPILFCNAFPSGLAWAVFCRPFWPPGCPTWSAAAPGCCSWPGCAEPSGASFAQVGVQHRERFEEARHFVLLAFSHRQHVLMHQYACLLVTAGLVGDARNARHGQPALP